MKRISYFESERMCEATFLSGGCWWHLYTPGNLTSLLFADDDDYRFAMNLTARCIAEFPALKVVAFEIMSNHLHIVLCGDKNIINEFFTLYRKRLKRYLSKKVQGRLSNQFQMSLKPINDLKALREAIVYVNRNGYVVNPSHTPFQRWSDHKKIVRWSRHRTPKDGSKQKSSSSCRISDHKRPYRTYGILCDQVGNGNVPQRTSIFLYGQQEY